MRPDVSGTGALQDVGSGRGKYYSLNVPLKDGLDDASFQRLFKPIMTRVMEVYNPGAVVLQCGADSLSHDRLGCFNLSLDGHAECVRFMKKFKVPLMVTGGGGYTKSNVARCWAYETAVVTEQRLKDDIPLNDYYEYFADGNYKLKLQVVLPASVSVSPSTLLHRRPCLSSSHAALFGWFPVQTQGTRATRVVGVDARPVVCGARWHSRTIWWTTPTPRRT